MKKITKILLIFCILLNSITSIVMATESIYEPLTGYDEPERYYGVYLRPDGSMRADTIMIPIVSTMWEDQIIGGILMSNVTLSRYELINNATLSLYFDGDLDSTSEDLWITVYGARSAFSEGATLQGLEPSHPITSAFTNVNLKDITSAQWVDIDVTRIVQEIVNLYGWSPGLGMAFLVYGTPTDTSRSYQSNIGTKYPYLNVTYGVYPDEQEGALEFVEQYRGLTIYQGKQEHMLFYHLDTQRFYTIVQPEPATGFTYGYSYVLTNHSKYANMAIEDQEYFQTYGQYTYVMAYNSSSGDDELMRSNDNGETWETVCMYYNGNHNGACAFAYDEVNNIYHFVYTINQNLYYVNYTVSTQTLGTPSLKHSALINYPQQISMDTDKYGNAYVAFDSASSGSSTRQAYFCKIDGETFSFSKDALTNEYLTGTGATGILVAEWTDRSYPFTEHSIAVCLWRWTDFSGTSDNRIFIHGWNCSSSGWNIPNFDAPGSNWEYFSSGSITLDLSPPKLAFNDYTGHAYVLFTKDIGSYGSPYIGYAEYIGGSGAQFDYKGQYLGFNDTVDQNGGCLWYDPANNATMSVLWEDNNGYAYFDDTDATIAVQAKTPTQSAELRIDGFNHTPSDFDFGGGGNNWISSMSFENANTWVVKDENGTIIDLPCLLSATTIEEAEACLDAGYFEDSGAIDDPGWTDESGWFTRGKMRLFFFILGLNCIFIPLYVFLVVDTKDKIMMFWLMLFMWVIGLAFLWSIPSI